ncbi:MAG: sensor histidine kinase [Gammaproteobacteria bacterium]
MLTNEAKGRSADEELAEEYEHLRNRLRRSEGWLATLVAGVPQSFMYMDSNQCVVFANAVFLENTGWTDKDVAGKHLSEIHGKEFYAYRIPYIERALAGETVSYEAVGKMGDGMGFFHHEFKPNFDSDGNVVGIFATATDITDRRRFELELEEKQKELMRSNKDLEQFAYVASHDLKAPLRAIDVLVQWLRDDLEGYEDGEVQENLNLLGQRTRRLSHLLDDLLAYSRLGRQVGDVVELDSSAMVRDLVELMGAPEGISVEIDGTLPVFDTYPVPLEQVLRNLIGNAVKHHPGPEGRISVSCEVTDDFFVFAVADDGEGIAREHADRVFKMFQTLKPRDEVEGSGMGLAIVSRIVEWQGGRVWFEDRPDSRGTVFKFQWQRSSSARDGDLIAEETLCRQVGK